MASDEQFSLCWNNFHANMSAGFHGLLSRGDLVDVTLAAEGRLLQAHKLVLSVCSPYFQEMFKMNPTQHPIVFLKDVSHSALRDLLQFMYQGEVNVKQEELASFISTAEQLQVKGLTGNQNEENSSTPSKPKPTSRPGPRSSQQRQSVMTKLETDLDSKPSSTPVAIKRPNRPSIASNNSSSSQSGPAKRKCVDPLEAGPSGSAKEEFVTIPDEDENNAVAPKMEPEFVNESMWDDDEEGANNDDTTFGEDDSNMEMTGFDGSATGDGNLTGSGEGGAVGDAQAFFLPSRAGKSVLIFQFNKFWVNNQYRDKLNWACRDKDTKGCLCRVQTTMEGHFIRVKGGHNHEPNFTPQNFDAPTLPEKTTNQTNDFLVPMKTSKHSNVDFYEKDIKAKIGKVKSRIL
ncbi:protein tramtrack, beta isoform-like isoform X7 [Ostrinia nubilalis]|uniref:protein tramtrack, beta isoform-like isoform X7 n=1 Tax=Ostrinia nubilalis TaxID=29057 RepID=UPI0030823903